MIRFENPSYGENTLVKLVTWQHRNKKTKQITQLLIVGLFGQVHLLRQKVLKPVILPLSGKMLKRYISSFHLYDPSLVSMRITKEATFLPGSQRLRY